MNNKVLIALIVLLGILCAYLGYKISEKSDDLEGKETEIQFLDEDRDRVKLELEKMAFSYDTLMVDNQALSSELIAEREKVEGLLKKINNKDYSIYKIRKEAETLRGIMKGYVVTIDSLNTLNQEQQVKIDGLTEKITQVSNQKTTLEQEKAQLQGKIEQGSVLQAGNVSSQGIRIKNSGKQVDTDRASKTEMIKTCFTIRKNLIAAAGDKILYIRILDPDAKVLPSTTDSGQGTFDGQAGAYSIQRGIDYTNSETDICIFYKTNTPGSLPKGDYKVLIYEGENKIGQTTLALK